MYGKIYWNTLLFFTLVLTASVTISAVDVFLYDNHAAKLGGPWGTFWLAFLLSLFAAGFSAVGYVVALGALESRFSRLTSFGRYSVALVATASLFIVLAADFVELILALLPFDAISETVVALLIVGALLGGLSLCAVHWWTCERRST